MGRQRLIRIAEGVYVESHALRFVEEELRRHRARIKAVESRKAAHARARPGSDLAPGGGRPSEVGDPTHIAVLRMQDDPELQAWEARVKRLEAGLALLPEPERKVLEMLYITRRYQINGVCMELGYSDRHVRRLRNEGLYTLAVAMGIVG